MPIQAAEPTRQRQTSAVHTLIALMVGAMTWHPAGAVDYGASNWSINGFGTLGVVHSRENQADFVSNPGQPKGAGFTDSWSATPDTKLGIQLDVALTQRLSAVVQVMSQYQYDGTFRPDLEWGNVKYQFTSDLSIRAGRIVIPAFLVSDSLNIGYALPFARIPLEVYAQLPVTHSDGIDGSYRIRVGDAANTVQAFIGRFKANEPNQSIFESHDLHGIVDTIEYGAATLHLSYQALHYDLRGQDPALVQDSQQLVTIGAGYDPGKWFASGELSRAPDDAFGLYYAWYVNGGRRFDSVTPYLGYARTNMSRAGSMGLPAFIDQDTATVGVRWDFRKNFDIKAQLDHINRHGGLNQFFPNQQPGFQPMGRGEIFTLLVDCVF